MPKNKQTRPTAATVEQVEGGAGLAGASVSTTDNTTAAESRQIGIAGLLSHGADHGVTLHHLEQITGLPGREIRKQIQLERLQHIPILANNRSGYYLAGNEVERERFVRSMKRRAAEIVKAAEAVEVAEIGGE